MSLNCWTGGACDHLNHPNNCFDLTIQMLTKNAKEVQATDPNNCPIQPNLDDHSQRGGVGDGENPAANKVRGAKVASGMFLLGL